MKKLLILPIVLLLILGTAGSLYAVSYTDVYNANRYMHGGIFGGDTAFWTFDITDKGFNPDTQDVSAASITLNFTDSKCFWDWSEFAYLDLGNNHFFWEVDTGNTTFQVCSLMTLSDTGKVDASLTAIWGDFYFNSALLKADGTLPDVRTSPVPEPAAIFLFGTGLMGLAFFTRRSHYFKKPE